MATGPDTEGAGGTARKLLVPTAIGLAGSAVGLVLTRKDELRKAAPKLKEAVSELPRPSMPEGGAGDLTSDLKDKVESVLGKTPLPSPGRSSTPAVDASELQERRRAREQRRQQRRARS